MSSQKLRVLVDLSFAARGYCGIAQDVRLLYKSLASRPELDVTGLVYLPHPLSPAHRFLPRDAHRGERIANQASFLWRFGDESHQFAPSKTLRLIGQLRQLASTALASSVQLDPLDMEIFWDFVWRQLFSPTLSADDIPLVRGGKFLLSNLANGMVQARAMLNRRQVKLDTRGFDFLIVQDPRSLRLSAETRPIVRYHDLIPVVRPDLMRSPWHIRWHHRAIRQHSNQTVFVCNSEPTRRDLTAAYPELVAQCTTIPNMLAESMYRETRAEAVARIISRRRSSAAGRPKTEADGFCPRYLMAVSTLEPRKNFAGLVAAFNLLKEGAASRGPWEDLKLMIVGSAAKKHESILSALRDPVERGDVVHLENVPVEEMRVLYSHAAAFACVSNYEGFGFPPLEAMQCGTPVIASDISAHRWVLGDAALYCNPYDLGSIVAAIERLLASRDAAALRTQLVARGYERVERYRSDRCGQRWVNLLTSLHSGDGLNVDSTIDDFSEIHALERVA